MWSYKANFFLSVPVNNPIYRVTLYLTVNEASNQVLRTIDLSTQSLRVTMVVTRWETPGWWPHSFRNYTVPVQLGGRYLGEGPDSYKGPDCSQRWKFLKFLPRNYQKRFCIISVWLSNWLILLLTKNIIVCLAEISDNSLHEHGLNSGMERITLCHVQNFMSIIWKYLKCEIFMASYIYLLITQKRLLVSVSNMWHVTSACEIS